jgi:uncharacterized protein
VNHARSELTAVLATGLAHFVVSGWLDLHQLFIAGACAFWVVFVAWRARSDSSVLSRWGFTRSGFGRSCKLLLPALVVAMACFVAVGSWTGNLLLHWHIALIALLYPAWGLVQQFLIVALVAGNLRRHTGASERLLVLLTAAIFAIAHAPSLALSVAAFCLAIVTTTVHFRVRNLWALGLFHGWYATGLYFLALGQNPWQEVVAGRWWP